MGRGALVQDVFEWAGSLVGAVPELEGVRLLRDQRFPSGMVVKEDVEEFDGSFALLCIYHADGVGRKTAEGLVDAVEAALRSLPHGVEVSDEAGVPGSSRAVTKHRGDAWFSAMRVPDGSFQIMVGFAALPDDGLWDENGRPRPDWVVPAVL